MRTKGQQSVNGKAVDIKVWGAGRGSRVGLKRLERVRLWRYRKSDTPSTSRPACPL